MRTTLPAILLASSSLALAACGSDDEGSTTTPTVSRAAAITAIDGTAAELQRSSAALERGDREAALESAKEAYVSNFEDAEAALEQADEELNEQIEDGLGKDLLADFEKGTGRQELAAAITALQEKLTQAKATLEK